MHAADVRPNKTCRPKRGGTPFLYSDNSLKYGDEGARPGGVIKADIPQPRSGEDVGFDNPAGLALAGRNLLHDQDVAVGVA